MTSTLRPLRESDLPEVTALNNSAYPAVPLATESEIAGLVDIASLALVAEEDGAVRGFLVAVDPGAHYDSENYVYFSARAAELTRPFLYIDRIVIGEGARGSGLGRRLYDAVFDRAAGDGRAEVTCEVNIEPPNPQSLAFHARMGFERVGEQPTKGGEVVVALLAAPVAGREGPAA
ncbi:GNAT family N-acetyltransferase [Amnibacterium flavum]|uniref:GNAT family N-acetyltransferase n=1 Tax=Amnibacterium flavum TaxID=2173173 RepID=A0A2V1HRF1_9MICO|nr:GNAT family N-acetyltransferase [Amnibacterium flavum]PVZ93689.1 GNAT family N-acetyltransferase [Amnibacterium flavum]